MLNQQTECSATRPPVQTIAVSGGKGGTGKSSIAVNLAVALAASGRRVLLLDADFALGNVHCLLGIQPTHDLGHVLRGECQLDQAMYEGPRGVVVFPAPNGLLEVSRWSQFEYAGLIALFSNLGLDADTMIIDVASGLSDSIVNLSRAAREVLVVVCDEPACMQDAYSMIRILHETGQVNRFRILSNKTQSSRHGLDVYGALSRFTESRIDVLLDYCGSIPDDSRLRQATVQQRAVIEAFPRSASALAFSKLAARVERWPRPETPGGHMEFFVERLVGVASGTR